ncbi:HesA/MoeB/ThiF family protein [Pelovirga terrestris]|uniref:HesA/MoeB/ThiF family protein n=1 Tax=Pelovirga terrestris TaxID=2771352 RepID=UPI003080331D
MKNPDLEQIQVFLADHAQDDLVSWAHEQQVMEQFGVTCSEVDELIMQSGFLPARYQRNRHMISISQQLQLLKSRVAVVGCGGLGGYVIEELARLGVGHLRVIDPDIFEEHNLNRQLLATIDNLGTSKAAAALKRVQDINPAVGIDPRQVAVGFDNGIELLTGMDVVVDAIDNISGRLELAQLCSQLAIPLVHGSIAGWFGQVSCIKPGQGTMQKLYANRTADKGIESTFGNPSFTPAVVGSLQAAEVCKILLIQGELLDEGILTVDLLQMQFDTIPVS